jgi:uncharacterized membrane protein YhhN
VTWVVPFAIAAGIAVLDWWAVATDRRDIERWAKPAVMVFLIAAAVLIPAESDWIRWWIVIGLVFGLVGDVLLFHDRFIPGAAAFLVGHLAYVVALLLVPQEPRGLLVGGVIVLLVAVFVGRQIVAGAWAKAPILGAIVAAYMLVIGVVVVLAVGSSSLVVAIAALLFLTSDALLAWARFVGPAPGGRVTVMVTYQLAQAGFVLAIPTLMVT